MKSPTPREATISQLSILWKFNGLFILVITLILAGLGVYQTVSTRIVENDRLKASIANASARLALNLAAPLWNMSDEQLRTVLETELRDEAFFGIDVFSGAKDQPMASLIRSNQGSVSRTPEDPLPTGLLITEGPIQWDGQDIGRYALYATTAPLERQLSGMIVSNIIQILVIDLLLSLMLLFQVNLTILGPLSGVRRMLKEISLGRGDLTKEIPFRSRDEIGDIAFYFNEFRKSLASILGSILEATRSLQAGGADLATNAEETAASAEQISANLSNMEKQILYQSTEMTGAVEAIGRISTGLERQRSLITQQSGKIEASTASVTQMNKHLDTVVSNIHSSARVFGDLTEASRVGKRQLEGVNTKIREIFSQSDNLLETTTAITGLASQTNLLAMNAAIEAAHAGEKGRGFAVVATEIRKLAESSAGQAKRTEEVLKQIIDAINEIYRASQSVETSFEDLGKIIESAGGMERQNEKAITEYGQLSREALDILTEVFALSRTVNASTDEVDGLNSAISGMLERLNQITASVKSGMSEILAGNREISNAVLSISQLSLKNKESIQQLLDQTAQFKIQE